MKRFQLSSRACEIIQLVGSAAFVVLAAGAIITHAV